MTTNTTAAPKTYRCTVIRSRDTMTVTGPEGVKKCVIELGKLDKVTLSAFEMNVLAPMEDTGEFNKVYPYDLTIDEMKAIASIRAKIVALSTAPIDKGAAAVHAGMKLKQQYVAGLDTAERNITGLQNIVKSCDQAFVMLTYDIPTRLNRECPNPSGILWNYGFRENLSCWILPKSQLDSVEIIDLMALWARHGVKTHVVEYAESQTEKIKKIAQEQLDEEIRRIHGSLITCIGNADEQLRKAQLDETKTAAQMFRADSYRNDRVRAIIREAAKDLDAAIRCAELFDEKESVADLLQGLRKAIASQAQTFNAIAEAKKVKPVEV